MWSRPDGFRALDLDETDIQILRCLQEDSRASFRDIAKKIGVSVPTVSARLATLEQLGIVKGYRAFLDPERLNETSVTLVLKAKLQNTEEVAKELAKLDGVRRVTIARSGRIIADATVVDRRDIDVLLECVASLPDVVDCEHFVGVRTIKEEPRAVLADSLTTTLICFQCKGPILGEPIKLRMDGRDHFLCCHSCERLYLEKYKKLKAAT